MSGASTTPSGIDPHAPPVTRVALVGVGLIGGSLGLALKRHAGNCRIVGFDRPEVLKQALLRGAIDQGAATLADAVSEADAVIVAAPLAVTLTLLSEMAPHLRPETVVSDVGSVKKPVMEHAGSVLPEGVEFVGGHPMTGSEKRGIENADALLFENAVYVLCSPTPDSDAFGRLAKLVSSTGARALAMGAVEHDAAAARVSHVPQLLAVALVNLIANDSNAASLAAGGFRDMTRIASSSFGIWRDILVANQGPILDELGAMTANLQRIRNRIAESDLDALANHFRAAEHTRAGIPAGTKGFLNPLLDVFVYTPDEPGALFRMTQALSEAGLDIKDIELLKIREGTGGTFRLGFADTAIADQAVLTLNHSGFHSYRL